MVLVGKLTTITSEEAEAVEKVSRLWTRTRKRDSCKWMGVRSQQWPLDLFTYQKIIMATKPQLIIETGTRFGGTTLFFAHTLDLMDASPKVKVVTIDIGKEEQVKHPRIIFLKGNSLSEEILKKIEDLAGTLKHVMIFLDSDHSKKHVLEELRVYSRYLGRGDYLIVNDTTMGYKELWIGKGNKEGDTPREAVEEFLLENPKRFVISKEWHWFLTLNYKGYLRRK